MGTFRWSFVSYPFELESVAVVKGAVHVIGKAKGQKAALELTPDEAAKIHAQLAAILGKPA